MRMPVYNPIKSFARIQVQVFNVVNQIKRTVCYFNNLSVGQFSCPGIPVYIAANRKGWGKQ